MSHPNNNPENTDKLNEENARVLLQITQQLRTHWSGVITSRLGYAVTLNVAIWSLFVKGYLDSQVNAGTGSPLYLHLAAAISAIALGLWQLYTHYIDHNIAGLYPDFLFYEQKLDVPSDLGTLGYLSRNVCAISHILCDPQKSRSEKRDVVTRLVRGKHIGWRGHLWIDLVALLAILLPRTLLLKLIHPSFPFLCGPDILILIGIFLIVFGVLYYQKNPCKSQVEATLFGLPSTERGAQ